MFPTGVRGTRMQQRLRKMAQRNESKRDGIGKPLTPQYDIRSDMVRREQTSPDYEIESDKARKRDMPRDGNGNETWGWSL